MSTRLQAIVVATEEVDNSSKQALWTQFTALKPVVNRVLEGVFLAAWENVTTYGMAVETSIESARALCENGCRGERTGADVREVSRTIGTDSRDILNLVCICESEGWHEKLAVFVPL